MAAAQIKAIVHAGRVLCPQSLQQLDAAPQRSLAPVELPQPEMQLANPAAESGRLVADGGVVAMFIEEGFVVGKGLLEDGSAGPVHAHPEGHVLAELGQAVHGGAGAAVLAL